MPTNQHSLNLEFNFVGKRQLAGDSDQWINIRVIRVILSFIRVIDVSSTIKTLYSPLENDGIGASTAHHDFYLLLVDDTFWQGMQLPSLSDRSFSKRRFWMTTQRIVASWLSLFCRFLNLLHIKEKSTNNADKYFDFADLADGYLWCDLTSNWRLTTKRRDQFS